MNYTTMSEQEFMQRYPRGLQSYEVITPEEFLREIPAKDYETITAQEFLQKYAPPETSTPRENFGRYPNSGRFKGFEKPLLEAGRIGGGVTRGLGYLIPGLNTVLTAADIYEGLNSPVNAADLNTKQSYTLENYVPKYVQPLKGDDGNYVIQGGLTHQYFLPPTNRTDNSITPNNGAPMLPFIQLDDNGVPSSQLQGRVEENYMLPPKSNNAMEDYYKKAKQFYGLMKTNPQVPFNVFNNFIQGDTKDLPGLLNGSSAGANM